MNTSKQKKYKELKVSLFIVWTIITVTIFIILFISFFLNKQTVLNISPTCISKSQFNVECSLCGMTRSFLEISHGSFMNAYNLNKGSIFLYSIFLLNSILFIIYVFNFIFFRKITDFIDDT